MASTYPEPEDKEAFIKAQLYDFNYDNKSALPDVYEWPQLSKYWNPVDRVQSEWSTFLFLFDFFFNFVEIFIDVIKNNPQFAHFKFTSITVLGKKTKRRKFVVPQIDIGIPNQCRIDEARTLAKKDTKTYEKANDSLIDLFRSLCERDIRFQ